MREVMCDCRGGRVTCQSFGIYRVSESQGAAIATDEGVRKRRKEGIIGDMLLLLLHVSLSEP